jgi:Tfp pilus assembly protein PilF
LYHAGMIARALGDSGAAARYLRQALATNPDFHPRQAAEARRALEVVAAERGRPEEADDAR